MSVVMIAVITLGVINTTISHNSLGNNRFSYSFLHTYYDVNWVCGLLSSSSCPANMLHQHCKNNSCSCSDSSPYPSILVSNCQSILFHSAQTGKPTLLFIYQLKGWLNQPLYKTPRHPVRMVFCASVTGRFVFFFSLSHHLLSWPSVFVHESAALFSLIWLNMTMCHCGYLFCRERERKYMC